MRRLTRSFVKVAVPVVVGGLVAASAGLALADEEDAQAQGASVVLDVCSKFRGAYSLYVDGFTEKGEEQHHWFIMDSEAANRCHILGHPDARHILWSTLKPPTLKYVYTSAAQPPISLICEAVRNAPHKSTVNCHAPSPIVVETE